MSCFLFEEHISLHPAKAEQEEYGEPAASGGLIGNICQTEKSLSLSHVKNFWLSETFELGKEVI